MSEDLKVEPYYMAKAKDLTNILFDKGFISQDTNRESIEKLEGYIGFLFQTYCQISVQSALLLRRVKGETK